MGVLYWQAPTAEALAATTPWYKPTDFVAPNCEVWDENWDVLVNVFLPLCGQLRMGPNGPSGLDFNAFFHALDRKGITGDEFDQYVADLRIIERAVIAELHTPR